MVFVLSGFLLETYTAIAAAMIYHLVQNSQQTCIKLKKYNKNLSLKLALVIIVNISLSKYLQQMLAADLLIQVNISLA